ncbi:MAG TPA: hypothetical protein VGK00_03715 [Anaerolineales bacterium]|jgi:hypothetical protein
MTDSERQQILKMIEDGKISPAQGLTLMRALDEVPDDEAELPGDGAEVVLPVIAPENPGDSFQSEHHTDPEFDRKLAGYRRLWVIPLWIGVAITVAGAYWMFTALQAGGFGFLFFLASLPFLFGVLLVVFAFSSRTSRWIYVNVKQKPGETPQQIVIAFPLSLVSWGLKFARQNKFVQDGPAGDVMGALLESTRSNEPLLVDVNDEDGEHVQVYIG